MTNENKTDLTFSNDWDILVTFGLLGNIIWILGKRLNKTKSVSISPTPEKHRNQTEQKSNNKIHTILVFKHMSEENNCET